MAERTEHLRTYQLSKQHSAKCQQLLNEIAAASVCLLDLKKRAAYDIQLRNEMAVQGSLPERMARHGPPPLPNMISPNGSAASSSGLPGWVMKLAFASGGLATLGLIFLATLVFQGSNPPDVASTNDVPVALADSPEELTRKAEELQPEAEQPSRAIDESETEETEPGAEAASANPSEETGHPPEAGAPDASETPLDRAIARATSSMVRISPFGGSSEAQPGAGFVLGDEGLIVTSYRTIQGATGAAAFFDDGSRVDLAAYVAVDERKDLALLPIGRSAFAPALFLASKLPDAGEEVAALNPPGARPDLNCTGRASGVLRGGQPRRRRPGTAGLGPAIPASLDPTATWIQTTATISETNRGGPLINTQGEVVGVNVWTQPGASGVNLALAAEEVQQLLLSADGNPSPLASLWDRNYAETAALPPAEPGIRLASGKVFQRDRFQDDRQEAESLVESWSREDASVIRLNDTKKTSYYIAYCRHNSGRLSGLAVTFHDEDTVKMCANYRNGERDGPLRLWDAEGQDLYWCDYSNGQREGICCLFKKDELWMISERSPNKVVHMVLLSEGKQVAQFDDRKQAQSHELASTALRVADDIESDIKKCEDRITSKMAQIIRSRGRKEKLVSKRENAAASTAAKTKSMTGRINQRRAEVGSQMNALRRKSGVSP
ncbi:MAG: trypsin-like peptidase domain-containing protein [Planctomycetes bacterium]|nr:trypsin-like peptidase domain-containing protein [Planctomycetota bacterium]